MITARAHLNRENGRTMAEEMANAALKLFKDCGDKAGQDIANEVLQEIGVDKRPKFDMMQYQMMGQMEAAPQDMGAGVAQSVVVEKPKGLNAEMVQQTVQEMAKAAIGLDDAVYLDSPLMDSGMDSLTAVSFRNGLQQNLGVKLPSSLMFDYPTMKEVAKRIVELSLED